MKSRLLVAAGLKYLGLGTRLTTSNPEIQAVGSWVEVPRLRYLGWSRRPAILDSRLLAAVLRYLGLGTLAGADDQQSWIPGFWQLGLGTLDGADDQ